MENDTYQGYPAWLTGATETVRSRPVPQFPEKLSQMTTEMRALEKQSFEIAFEFALEAVSGGITFESFCREYHTPLNAVRFRNWVFTNASRRVAYMQAKMLGAEAIEDDLIRIADGLRPDGTPSLDDPQRTQQMLNIRKWLLQVWNRRRYGDVKQIEQTTRVESSQMTKEELQQRLLVSLGIIESNEIMGELIDIGALPEVKGDEDGDS
jgi:hypothetical protein